MTISTELDTLHAEKTQKEDVVKAKAVLQNVRSVILQTNAEIQAIVDSGSFETIDKELKPVLLAAWNVVELAQTAFEDAGIAELLNWRPNS